jgi:Kef-type K+ transport system membrane component KefB
MASRAGHPNRPLALTIISFLLIVLAVLLFLLIRFFGQGLTASASVSATAAMKSGGKVDVLPHILLALVIIILSARIIGGAFAWLGQPPVIGEVLAGILLGPSFLGAIAPAIAEHLLSPEVVSHLNVLAQLGMILYLFVVGLELDTTRLRQQGLEAVAISAAGMVVSFLLGSSLALGLYPRLAPVDVPFTVFALFLGVALAITAFPVLARILTDLGLSGTRLGNQALACAALGDVAGWCLLALAVGVAQARIDGAVRAGFGTILFFVVMVFAVRPLLLRWLPRQGGKLTQGVAAVLLMGVLASAWATESIGIHALFGAFLFGVLIPHDSPSARQMEHRLRDAVTVMLLPAYFAFTGLRTRIGLMAGAEQWLLCLLIVIAATLGKFGGTFLAARFTGAGWRDAVALGVLMNTRGLMELVVLNIGLDLGVISPALFAMMVLMAVATTMTTAPVLRLLGVPRPDLVHRQDIANSRAVS